MPKKYPRCHTEDTGTARFCSSRARPFPDTDGIGRTKTLETPREELTSGSVFANRYQIIEELGKGGMGRVYKVLEQSRTNNFLCLKRLLRKI
jgi:serine/threonine protein kinase